MKPEIVNFYINVAKKAAQLSYCNRRKVGAVLVDGTGENILAFGYNGTIKGMPNVCELEDGTTDNHRVLHAETNAIMKVARSTNSTEGSILFVTLSPCVNCAKIIIQSGIKAVYFDELYKDISGIDILFEAGISTYNINQESII